jgi:hypothetical protein
MPVHPLERAGILDLEHLSRWGKLAEVGYDRIPQLEAGVSQSDANGGSTGCFNQIGGLVAAGCQIHMPDSLVEDSARCGSMEKLNTRLTVSFMATQYSTDTGTVTSCTCLQRMIAAYLPSEGPQLLLEALDGLSCRYVAVEAHEPLRGADERGLIPVSGVQCASAPLYRVWS